MKKMTTWIKVLTGSLLAVAFLVIAGVLCPTNAYAGGFCGGLLTVYGTLNEEGDFEPLDESLQSSAYEKMPVSTDNYYSSGRMTGPKTLKTFPQVITPSGATIDLDQMHNLGDEYDSCPVNWIGWDLVKIPEVGTYKLIQSSIKLPAGYELDDTLGLGEGSAYPLAYVMTQAMVDRYIYEAENEAGHEDYPIEIPVKKIGTTSPAQSLLTAPTQKLVVTIGNGRMIRSNVDSIDDSWENMVISYEYATSENGSYQQLAETDIDTYYIDAYDYSQLKHGETYYIRTRIGKTIKAGQTLWGPYSDPVKLTVANEFELIAGRLPNMGYMSTSKVWLHWGYYTDTTGFNYTFSYATSENGPWTELYSGTKDSIECAAYPELKDGKTYYFKVTVDKGDGSRPITCDPTPLKVLYYRIDAEDGPQLRTLGNSPCTLASWSRTFNVTDDYSVKCSTIIYYSTSKKGTYKKLGTIPQGGTMDLTKYSKLKKGKTYYFKGRFSASYTWNGAKISTKSKAGSVLAVKIKK